VTDELRQSVEQALSGSYTVERELGGGGMSRVFVATEHALGRHVVVKVLSPDLAADVNTERFRREIQVIAQMQHSCTVPVLSSGVAGGLPYYTMPLIEGESLRTRLAREGQLPIQDVARILRDILEALSYAHEHGIVHRDIKPENVLLTRHHALVTDFGVAKALSASTNPGAPRLTTAGMALGTPAYMAPEQAAADPSTDHRADLYAVGALGYEMLTGQQVFSARSPQATLAAHAVEKPEPVGVRRSTTPPGLAALVMRALEKHPADRPQSADDMLRELETIATPSGTVAPVTDDRRRRARVVHPYVWTGAVAVVAALLVAAALLFTGGGTEIRTAIAAPSVAVLPFANTGGSRDDDYLSDGLSEELIGALSRVPGLQVAARTSSFAFKGRNEDARTIGQRLGVGHILGGSVRRAGNRLRVSAQLTSVQTGYNLWSDTYDREMTDVFALQEDISRAIVDALQIQLASSGEIVKRTTRDPQAYAAYLRGRYLLNQRGASLPPALESFKQAVARDSGFAAAWAGLAETYYVSASWWIIPASEALPKAEAAVGRALELDPRLVEALATLGSMKCDHNDFEAADQAFRQALELEPRSGRAHYFYSLCLSRAGRLRESVDEARRAIELEPLNAQFGVALARPYVTGGQPRRALALLRPAMELAPRLASLRHAAATAYTLLRETENLARIADTIERYSPQFASAAEAHRAAAAALIGDTARALQLVRTFADIRGTEMDVAKVYALLGNNERALDYVELAYERRTDLVAHVNYPWFDHLRGHPRFIALARRYNIPLRVERLD
jgi:TolB-like protein/tRNA A-37 threonylcarbamoyl transferase component Bud32/Flp pilus assembly protein TadD